MTIVAEPSGTFAPTSTTLAARLNGWGTGASVFAFDGASGSESGAKLKGRIRPLPTVSAGVAAGTRGLLGEDRDPTTARDNPMVISGNVGLVGLEIRAEVACPADGPVSARGARGAVARVAMAGRSTRESAAARSPVTNVEAPWTFSSSDVPGRYELVRRGRLLMVPPTDHGCRFNRSSANDDPSAKAVGDPRSVSKRGGRRESLPPEPAFSRKKKTRMAKLTGGTVAPISRDKRPGHGGIVAASAAPRAAAPTPLAIPASPPHSPAAIPSLPPAAAASPSSRSPAPSPSPPDPARPDADRWPDARGSDGCRRRAPGRCSSAAGPASRSRRTSPASSSWSLSGSASGPPRPTAHPPWPPPDASGLAVAPGDDALSRPATAPGS